MALKLKFTHPVRYALRSSLSIARSIASVTARRAVRGPKLPGWDFEFELCTHIMKSHLATAFAMADINHARQYLDAVLLKDASTMSNVTVSASAEDGLKGDWFFPNHEHPSNTLLYLHGGGFSFYPKTYVDLIASVTVAAGSRTLALDYKLSPEHRFPAALDDVVRGYECLLKKGVNPNELAVAGDSAGGNLTLALMIRAREMGLPLPAVAVAMSPATDFVVPEDLLATASFLKNQPYDWVQPHMLMKWADWYCDEAQRTGPLVSPIYADLRGLPPIYIQAGRAEILYDSIEGFVNRARQQGANVVLESWQYMNHDFQMMGHFAPQSVDALRRIGEVIRAYTCRKDTSAVTGSSREGQYLGVDE